MAETIILFINPVNSCYTPAWTYAMTECRMKGDLEYDNNSLIEGIDKYYKYIQTIGDTKMKLFNNALKKVQLILPERINRWDCIKYKLNM